MTFDRYYTVHYQGRVRHSTVFKDEAENYADALYAKAGDHGDRPVVEVHTRKQ